MGGGPAVDAFSEPVSLPISCDQIDALINERNELRRQKKWNEADRIKVLLKREPYTVELFDRGDGVTVWRRVGKAIRPLEKRVSWFFRGHARSSSDSTNARIPLVIATVDTPHYRKRLQETMDHLSHRNETFQDGIFVLHSVDMLDLNKNTCLRSKRIVFEGWRQVLLPHLLRKYNETMEDGFIVVVEDDVRLPTAIHPGHIRDICVSAFQENPDIDVLSLGHSWSTAKPSRRQRRRHRKQQLLSADCNDEKDEKDGADKPQKAKGRSLLHHLQAGGGIHGATMLAIRTPDGITSFLGALNGIRVPTHFDQFLFHSTGHTIGVALIDPPLAGWAEVTKTLTSVGSGQRKIGGGRIEHLPDVETGHGDVMLSCQLIVRKLERIG